METKAKLVIFNKDVAKYVKIVAESLNANHKLQLLSIEDIVSLNENTIAVIDNEPVIVEDVRTNNCLIFWNKDTNGYQNKFEYLTHADAF